MQVSNFTGDIGGFKLAPSGDRVVVWADRDLRCADLDCAGLPAKPKTGIGPHLRPAVHPPLGHLGRAWRALAPVRLPDRRAASWPARASRSTGNLVGDTPSKPFGGGEEIGFSPDGRTVYFALREAGRIEPLSTNLDIFAAPSDGSAPPVNLTAANRRRPTTLPTVSPDGRTLAYVAMARPGYEADRQVLMLRDLATGTVRAADPELGPLGRLDRMGAATAGACWSPPRTRSRSRCSASTPRPARSRA